MKESQEEITIEEIRETIKNLKKGKAPGQDGITNEAWKKGGYILEKELWGVLNDIGNGGEVPEEWKTGIVRPIYKKGKRNEAGNYRGITLMDTGYKIYAEILRKRLEKEIEEKQVIDQTQMGFREGKGTIEAIFSLKRAIEGEIKKERGKVIVCFADMKAAFDKLRRKKI